MTDYESAKMRFLTTLARNPDGARRGEFSATTREAGRVRQKCRKEGLAVYEERSSGKRWHITDAGRAFLSKPT